MAIVIISSATTEGADANPVVTRAIASASAGPFLLSAMGFAALLMAAGLLTLRSGVFARWTGVVALIGAVSFLVAFAAVLSGLGEDSLFGFGFFPGVLALVIWSIATSIARYRAVTTSSGLGVAPAAHGRIPRDQAPTKMTIARGRSARDAPTRRVTGRAGWLMDTAVSTARQTGVRSERAAVVTSITEGREPNA